MKPKTETVTLMLSDSIILKIALLAHDRDITFNSMCNILLKEAINEIKTRNEKKQSLRRRTHKRVTGIPRPANKRVSNNRSRRLAILSTPISKFS